ncbi:MAG: glycosyltransferase family 4 protein [DPANN group archaeon]|nr:glycosyltransferase family 4 protein [DPANN group archaeon]
MKIAHICPFFKPTICGVGQVVYELAKRQVRAGHEVHVFCADTDKKRRLKKKNLLVDGIFVHRIPYWFRVTALTYVWPEIFFKILGSDFSVIHTHSLNQPHTFLAGLAARIKKVPVVHTTHSPWIADKRNFLGNIFVWPMQNVFGRLALKWANKIIILSPYELQFIKKLSKKKNEIIPIPNGVSAEFFNSTGKNNMSKINSAAPRRTSPSIGFKKKYKINGKMVLFLARINKIKGPDILMAAAKKILAERNDVTFVFAGGDDGYQKELEILSGGDSNLKILGRLPREDVIAAYNAADIYVLPSKREGMPLTLFEAMAAGCPVIATPVNNVPYAMSEPENGFFVNYSDVAALKEKIIKLLSDRKLRNRISKANKNHAKKYDWDNIAGDIEFLYKQAIANKESQK